MYIIAIGWIYVVLMMSITETTIVAGVMTFVLYGIVPTAIIVYIMGTPGRRRRRIAEKNMTTTSASEEASDSAVANKSSDPDH